MVRVPEISGRKKGAPEPAAGFALGLDLSFGFLRYAAARAPGASFVCADAARLPFKDGSLRAVSVSFGLHDKSPELRTGDPGRSAKGHDPRWKAYLGRFRESLEPRFEGGPAVRPRDRENGRRRALPERDGVRTAGRVEGLLQRERVLGDGPPRRRDRLHQRRRRPRQPSHKRREREGEGLDPRVPVPLLVREGTLAGVTPNLISSFLIARGGSNEVFPQRSHHVRHWCKPADHPGISRLHHSHIPCRR
ncbi:MAG: hypothetical protein MZU79_07195 [Anaerotruncus sp.]|nr:hypothetical protein [Anaerotruncus sp.]